MKRFRKNISPMHWLLLSVVAFAVTACASMGRPEGGDRDVTPPEFRKVAFENKSFADTTPHARYTNIKRDTRRIVLEFNENVQLEDAMNKIIVSPTLKKDPKAVANGKHIYITIDDGDTLADNTTYTIDFGDAIKDLNEGNILDGYTLNFSTGSEIDSLRISGMVFEARTLEPAQGMLVGVYSNLADSAILTLPLERVARTNQYGQFTIHGLKPGEYQIYAIDNPSSKYRYGQGAKVAFFDETIKPYTERIKVYETNVVESAEGASSTTSLQTTESDGIRYLPNNILLGWFDRKKEKQQLKKADSKRVDLHRFNIMMNTAADTLPIISVASKVGNGKSIDEIAIVQKNATLDSLTYWLTDSLVMQDDSLRLSVSVKLFDDSLMTDYWKTDTLNFYFRKPVVSEKKEKKNKNKEAADTDSVEVKINFMEFKAKSPSTQEVNRDIVFAANEPILSIDPEALHLEKLVDTLWVEQRKYEFVVDSLNPLLQRRLVSKWEPGQKYRFSIDSASVYTIYGEFNKPIRHEFQVRELEEYSDITFAISGLDGQAAFVELLDNQDKPTAIAPVVDGKAVFKYLMPSVVYARLFIDANNNGKWDEGNLELRIQPEDVFYFPKKIDMKKNWSYSQEWDLYATMIDQQKPNDIKQNKPKLKKGEKEKRDEEEEEEEEENNVFGDYNTYSNARRGGNNNVNAGRGGFR